MARKPTQTAQELEDMIHKAINVGGVRVVVRPNRELRWDVQVTSFPAQADRAAMQAQVDRVAEELRKLYDLRPARTGPLGV